MEDDKQKRVEVPMTQAEHDEIKTASYRIGMAGKIAPYLRMAGLAAARDGGK